MRSERQKPVLWSNKVLKVLSFSTALFQCLFQLPGCKEAHAEEVVARFHV